MRRLKSFPRRGPALEPLELRRLMAASYRLIDLGTLGGANSFAYDVNDNNVIIGHANNAAGQERAFRFADSNGNGIADPGEMTHLGALDGDAASYAWGVNNAGHVVGTSRSTPTGADGVERAVRFNNGGPVTDLNLGDGSNARDIDSAGQIVGGVSEGNRYLAFLRSSTGKVSTFALGAPFSQYSEAQAVNDAGVVVGFSGGNSGDSAFVRAANGTLTPVAHPDASDPYSYAWDLNADGDAVGEGFNSAGHYRAFKRDNGVVTDLDTLDGFGSSEAYGVNDAGWVVGRVESTTGGPNHAFLFDGAMHDLNSLIPAGSGWVLTEARAVNNGGAIVGFGRNPAGQTRAFLLQPVVATVVARHVFYNNSAFDGRNPAANAADDGAIATDKRALFPGQSATFANYTSYSRGINGVMVDLPTLPANVTPTAADFTFRTGNDNNPAGWPAAPVPAVTLRRGAGVDGSDRVTFVWADGSVRKTWLQVTVKANANSGVGAADVFYFGNAVAESGNSAADAAVNYADELGARAHRRTPARPAPVDYRWDYNRDGVVDVTDQRLARSNVATGAAALRLITVPGASAAAAASPARARPASVGGFVGATRVAFSQRRDEDEAVEVNAR